MSGFSNAIAGGITLVRPALRSPNFLTGSTGWTINADGSAEFNNLVARGSLIVGPASGSHMEVLPGTAAPAELVTFYGAQTIGACILQYSTVSPDRYTYQVAITPIVGTTVYWASGQVNSGTVTEVVVWVTTAGNVTNITWRQSGGGHTWQATSGIIGNPGQLGFNNWDLQCDGGVSMPRGVRAMAIITASSANVTAETVVNSFNQPFLDGRAYMVGFGGRVDTSDANGRPRLRLRKTNAAGTLWADFGGYTTNANAGEDQAVRQDTILVRAAGAGDLNGATTCLTLEHLAGGANTARLVASATNPFWFGMYDVGAASSYPNAVAVT